MVEFFQMNKKKKKKKKKKIIKMNLYLKIINNYLNFNLHFIF